MLTAEFAQSLALKAKLFRGFSDPSRLAILETVREAARSVTEIVDICGLTQSNVSNHLACLLDCGLVTGKEGMGHGDFKLLAAIGAWVGLSGVLPTILLSSLVGALVGSAWLTAKGRDRATPIPFGPYLAIAGWIVFFWGDKLVDAYLRFAGLP